MKTSVIVVAYNSRRHLPACLSSILAAIGPLDELIIVDNGSSDGSAELVERHFPQARLIRGANVGYAGGNNCGAAAARGEYLVFLNPDTVIAPGAIEALVAPLRASGDIGLTTACIVHLSRPELVNACGNTMHVSGLTYCRGAGRPRAAYDAPADVDAVSGAAFAIPRDLFEELGGFDERFFLYCEDTDLSWRARLAGKRCCYVPEALVYHDYQVGYSPTKAFYVERNRHLMLLKNLDRSTYLRLLPVLLLAELVTWGFLLLQGPRYWLVKPRVYHAIWREIWAPGHARRAAGPAHRQSNIQLVARMTHRLEFAQLADPRLARAAALFFHPAFWSAKHLAVGEIV